MHETFDQRRYLIPFRSTLLPQIFVDTLVIGSGAAGLSAALSAAVHGEVIVLSKGEPTTSNTSWAQGGIAAVLDETDSIESHVRDTLDAGAGLCDVETVERIVGEGPDAIEWLIRLGFRVDRDERGSISLGREGAHSARRILHADGDQTGAEVSRALIEAVRANDQVRVFGSCFALDLLTPSDTPGSPCLGAITHHPRFGLQVIWARSTILASGGSGVIWRETSNPPLATGDGLALAYRAGASVADLAFMQFHPTTLYIAGAPRLLITEAVRGEGATLVDANGTRFMQDVDPRLELAPRDVVSRAIQNANARCGSAHVWLDCRSIESFALRFPGIASMLGQFDIDPAHDPVPVNPAAHYLVGGVVSDRDGRTDVPGLYAVGECASTGLHGANRLASNSLLEALVLGRTAGAASAEMLGDGAANAWNVPVRGGPVKIVSDIPPSQHGELDLADVRSSMRAAMWRNVGVERSGAKLRDAGDMLDFWARYTLDKIFDEPDGWETQNMLLGGALVTRSAAWRAESRGCHARTDVTEPLDEFRVHDRWRRGRSEPSLVPVSAAEERCVQHPRS
ncbi:MAG: L-aspartate oxidase [Planctomycetota bacterium]